MAEAGRPTLRLQGPSPGPSFQHSCLRVSPEISPLPARSSLMGGFWETRAQPSWVGGCGWAPPVRVRTFLCEEMLGLEGFSGLACKVTLQTVLTACDRLRGAGQRGG